ncbi:MAG: ATP-binding protein [Myxococcaceae bacterium]|nr:ATP-binding protein [Myxococcaceae bacterium]MBH2006028.1 ATP-binding protein [Myxococcaceae bacterium]
MIYPNRSKLIVLTGGPGAGKTTVLEMVKHMFTERVIVLHEAASMIYNGGFMRRSTPSAVRCAQRAIYHIQREQERIVEEEGFARVGLCDRGTLDGLAYWPGEPDDFFKSLGTTKEAELARYEMVIHMRTPSLDLGYNNDNPARTEAPEHAAELDQRMIEVWDGHPNHFIVDSRQDFLHKAEEVVEIVSRLL